MSDAIEYCEGCETNVMCHTARTCQKGGNRARNGWVGISLSPELLRLFPKPCRPRKAHRCRLCDGKIEIGEPCCRWEYLEPGEGYGTSHAHPECYQLTLDDKWDDGDWECAFSGDVVRPNTG